MCAVIEHDPQGAGLESNRGQHRCPEEREGRGHVLKFGREKHAGTEVDRPGRESSWSFHYDFPACVEGQRQTKVDADLGGAQAAGIQDPSVLVFGRFPFSVYHGTMVPRAEGGSGGDPPDARH